MSDVSDEQAVPEPEGDPLLVALDQGLGELTRLAEVRDGPSVNSEDSTGDRSSASGDADADEPIAAEELERLDVESGQAAWREDQYRQQEEFDQFQQQQWLAETADQAEAELEQREGYGRQVLADALERLSLAVDWDDVSAAWHAADEVASSSPERLPAFLQNWYASDPIAARQYAAAIGEGQYAQQVAEYQQAAIAEQNYAAEAADAQDREAWEQHTKLQEANAEALKAEVQRLDAADPAFARLAPTMLSLAQTTLEQLGDPQSPEEAAAIVRSAYENAVALQTAQEKASFLSGIDEALHHQKLAADRTGEVDRFDPEAAHVAATLEFLKSSPLGTVSEARRRHLAGETVRSFDRDLAGLDEELARKEASLRSVDESGAAIDRARARREAEKKNRHRPPGRAA
jgi:hypothetical protein